MEKLSRSQVAARVGSSAETAHLRSGHVTLRRLLEVGIVFELLRHRRLVVWGTVLDEVRGLLELNFNLRHRGVARGSELEDGRMAA